MEHREVTIKILASCCSITLSISNALICCFFPWSWKTNSKHLNEFTKWLQQWIPDSSMNITSKQRVEPDMVAYTFNLRGRWITLSSRPPRVTQIDHVSKQKQPTKQPSKANNNNQRANPDHESGHRAEKVTEEQKQLPQAWQPEFNSWDLHSK